MEFDFAREPGRRLLARNMNTDAAALVSIITPFYNAGRYFEQTYNCVMNQTFPWYEWIIVDDGSTDRESVALLERLCRQDRRIRTYRKENGGIASARNYGIKKSKTDIVIPLDADDLISCVYVEKLYWALYTHPDASWAYSDCVGFQNQKYLWKKDFSSERMKNENLLVCTAAIRKEVLQEVGCYNDSEKHHNEDWLCWLQLLSQKRYPVHVAGYDFWYRRLEGGVLSYVKSDQGTAQRARDLIAEAAKQIDSDVQAVEYPFRGAPGQYIAPKLSSWEHKTYGSHAKKHILMVLPWLEMGGADLFNLEVCRRLDQERYEISIVTTVPGENSWKDMFEAYITDLFILPDFLETKDYPEFISYLIRSREIDLLFLSNSYYGYYLLPWLRTAFPQLAIMDYVHMEEWYWRNGGYARTSGVMGEVLDKTYVCNERTRQVLIRDFKRLPETVETLYIGVDTEHYNEALVEAGLARKQLRIAGDRPIVLFPCRIHPQKRPFLMLQIARQIKRIRPDIAFVVVGDGPQLEELRHKVESEKLTNTVYLAGRQEDVRPFYKDCSITLICSLKEGLSLTAYESLSMCRPVLTADVGGQAELVDGSVGRIVPILQSEQNELDSRNYSEVEIKLYVDAILDILSDEKEYKAICLAGRKRIETGFSLDIMVEKLVNIITNLTNTPELTRIREENAAKLRQYPHIIEEMATLYSEIEAYEMVYKHAYVPDTKNELMRIANSKWGARLIKLAFKMRLNKLF